MAVSANWLQIAPTDLWLIGHVFPKDGLHEIITKNNVGEK